MPQFLQDIFVNLGRVGTGILSLVPAVAVILVLVVVQRALGRQSRRTTGLRFRNQLITAGAAFVGILIVVVVLPIDTDIRSQLLTLIGIIITVTISLSSSTFLGNAMAGIMLKAVRSFRSGDFVQVGEHFGRVTERGLFHTEIQTPTRDLTTLPNLFLATSPVTVVRADGTVVDATVSLGYDVPHGRIEALLLGAAENAGLSDPFVQVMELGDFSVTYRVAGLLEDTKRLLTFRSRLRACVLDGLHGDGVEIVSPDFMNVRDFANDRNFIPRAAAVAPRVSADADVGVVFDKAEEAESLENLRERLVASEAELAALEGKLKSADDANTRKAIERKREQALRRRERLAELVAAAEAKETDGSA